MIKFKRKKTPLYCFNNSNLCLISRVHDASLRAQTEFNERIIEEREHDLVGLEQSIAEVNGIFRDLGSLVNEQQYLLDNIESNVNSVSINMENATGELRTASNYQSSAEKKYIWIFLILLVTNWMA